MEMCCSHTVGRYCLLLYSSYLLYHHIEWTDRYSMSCFDIPSLIPCIEMNESPVPSQHGAPIRVIVPGHVGVRNVKWVTSIRVSDEEATGPWQRGMAYKVGR